MFGLAICCGTVATMIGLGYFMQHRGFKGGRIFYLSGLGISSLLVFTGAALSITMHPAFAEAAAAPRNRRGHGLHSSSFDRTCMPGSGGCRCERRIAALGLVGEAGARNDPYLSRSFRRYRHTKSSSPSILGRV